MTDPTRDTNHGDGTVMAAVMAAVRAYVDDEEKMLNAQTGGPGRAWKLSAWLPTTPDVQLRRVFHWRRGN